jgi:hypothetical protein
MDGFGEAPLGQAEPLADDRGRDDVFVPDPFVQVVAFLAHVAADVLFRRRVDPGEIGLGRGGHDFRQCHSRFCRCLGCLRPHRRARAMGECADLLMDSSRLIGTGASAKLLKIFVLGEGTC